MLDTRSKISVADRVQRTDHRIDAWPTPSFGLGSLWNRRKLLAISTAIFLVIGLLFTLLRPTTYTASSQLLVYTKQVLTGADAAILPGRADLPLVQNQIELLRSGKVLVKLVEDLRAEAQASRPTDQLASFDKSLDSVRRNLSVRQVGSSHMITVKFTASEPENAARITNKLIRVYFQELARGSEGGHPKRSRSENPFQSLGPSAYLISKADPPIKADGPPGALIVSGAALLGLGIAAALAILLDAINDTIRSSRQIEFALGLECLGVVCKRADMDFVGNGVGDLPRASEDQALRRITAALLDASLQGLRTIGVTSAVPGEGTTTLSVGIARAMAASGKRVLLIDGCPENPSLSRWAGSTPRIPAWSGGGSHPGIFENIVDVQRGLHVLPLAEEAANETSSTRAASLNEILPVVTETYDFVIVDMLALAAAPDVRAAAEALDAFLLVVKWGSTESELVQQALHSAGEARPKFIGAVLNMADENTMRRYGDRLPPS